MRGFTGIDEKWSEVQIGANWRKVSKKFPQWFPHGFPKMEKSFPKLRFVGEDGETKQ